MNAKHVRAVRTRIQDALDALTYADEALDKGDADEVENQLDIASVNCGDALSISEHLNDAEAARP